MSKKFPSGDNWWDWGWERKSPQQPAVCRACGGDIQKGGEAVCLYTRVSNNSGPIYFHPQCVPTPSDLDNLS
jgi:hypothetical protein